MGKPAPCKISAPPGMCHMSQIASLTNLVNVRLPFFGVVFYYATWGFLGTTLLSWCDGRCVLLCTHRAAHQLCGHCALSPLQYRSSRQRLGRERMNARASVSHCNALLIQVHSSPRAPLARFVDCFLLAQTSEKNQTFEKFYFWKKTTNRQTWGAKLFLQRSHICVALCLAKQVGPEILLRFNKAIASQAQLFFQL